MSRLRLVFAWVLVTIVLGFVVHADDRAGDDWTVVVAENVGGPVIESTKYMAHVMGESLGRSVPVVKESQWGGRGHAVFVGDVAAAVTAGLTQGNLAYEEYAVKSVDGNVIVNGKDALGRVYAIHEFLNKGLGVEHFDAFNRHVPTNASPDLARLDIRRRPDFRLRHIFEMSSWKQGPYPYLKALKASNCKVANPIYGQPGNCHTFYDYQKDWPTNRTDWLAKDENGRPRRLLGKLGPCFCMTNRDAWEDFRVKLLRFIAEDEAKAAKYGERPPYIYHVSPNDGCGYLCKCPACAAITERRGESALLLDFVNHLARAVPKTRPDIRVATFAYGSQRIYDYIDDNPSFVLLPTNYVNDPYVIAQNDNMISVNAAVEVDLWGQVCAETIGTRILSGTGGQVDFVRGACQSKGGKSFIAFSSTVNLKGTLKSKIQPILAPGSVCTTGKNDVDYIVTEYGIAKLRGRPLSERVRSLIAIAHPDFRDELTFEAKKLGMLI